MIYLTIFILTLADLGFTTYAIMSGNAIEGNPLLAWAYNTSPILTGLCMAVIIGMFLLIVYKYRNKYTWVKYPIYVILIVKIAVVLYHIICAIII